MASAERGVQIQAALRTLRRSQLRAAKKGSRTHVQTLEARAAKTKALTLGPCKDCQGLKIEVYEEGYCSPDVSLGCSHGESPLNLHLLSELGEVPKCSVLDSLKAKP